MTEVKDFDRQCRFKKYLAMEETRIKLVDQPTLSLCSERKSHNNNGLKSDLADISMAVSETTLPPQETTSPRLLSSPPQLPKFMQADEFNPQPTSQNSQTISSSSHSMGSSSYGLPQMTPIPPWAVPPATLPPPFSQGTRAVSDQQTLPSPPGSTRPPAGASTERPLEPPTTPPRQSSLRDTRMDGGTSPPSGGVRTGLLRSAVRLVGSYVRSPNQGSPSRDLRSASGSPSVDDRDVRFPDGLLQSSDPRFRIYNDSLPAASQPQTPMNLPEARHQSRIEGSYTAPVSRVAQRTPYHSGTVQRRDGRGIRGRAQISSPSGLDTPGFQGLYGGIENSDDVMMLRDATRFPEGHNEDG